MELRYINEILLGKKIFETYCKKKDFLANELTTAIV